MSGETPKKVTSAEGDCFLCKDKIPSLKEKVKIFGKSELQIGALIHRALGVDLGVYVGSENLAICRLCYNMLNAYNKALKKVNQIVDGIKQKFESNGPLRIKRLSKDSTKAQEARKSLSFDSNPWGEISRGPPLPVSLKPPDNVCVSVFQRFRRFLVLVPLAQSLHSRFLEHQIVYSRRELLVLCSCVLCRPQHQRRRARFQNDRSPKRKYIFPLNIPAKLCERN